MTQSVTSKFMIVFFVLSNNTKAVLPLDSSLTLADCGCKLPQPLAHADHRTTPHYDHYRICAQEISSNSPCNSPVIHWCGYIVQTTFFCHISKSKHTLELRLLSCYATRPRGSAIGNPMSPPFAHGCWPNTSRNQMSWLNSPTWSIK